MTIILQLTKAWKRGAITTGSLLTRLRSCFNHIVSKIVWFWSFF